MYSIYYRLVVIIEKMQYRNVQQKTHRQRLEWSNTGFLVLPPQVHLFPHQQTARTCAGLSSTKKDHLLFEFKFLKGSCSHTCHVTSRGTGPIIGIRSTTLNLPVDSELADNLYRIALSSSDNRKTPVI